LQHGHRGLEAGHAVLAVDDHGIEAAAGHHLGRIGRVEAHPPSEGGAVGGKQFAQAIFSHWRLSLRVVRI